jgi:exodeoxyribonuclease-3
MYHANEHSLYDPGRYRIISWNVNGLRQRHQMNQFLPVFRHNPDIVCVQETKITADRIPKDLKKVRGYSCYYDRENPDGFTQVVLYSKQEPESVTFGFGNTPFDREGRILIAEFETFTLMNLYFPLGIRPADTPEHKLAFYDAFLAYVSACKTARKNLIICGDFSIAHTDIDVARKEKKSTQRAGITAVERQKLDQLIDAGFSDTFRLFNRSDGHYSWWPNGFTREERRSGWRLDYFFVNAGIRPLVTSTEILACHEGSDHCPVMMTMNLPDQVRQEKQCAPAGVCRYHEGIPT